MQQTTLLNLTNLIKPISLMPTMPIPRTLLFPETPRFVFELGLTTPKLLLKPNRVGAYRFVLNFSVEIVSQSRDLTQCSLIQNHRQFHLKQPFWQFPNTDELVRDQYLYLKNCQGWESQRCLEQTLVLYQSLLQNYDQAQLHDQQHPTAQSSGGKGLPFWVGW
jgi:hypothetical protein